MHSTPDERTRVLCDIQPTVNRLHNAAATGQLLYEASALTGPAWHQLGEVTRSVWAEKARRYNGGDPRWWSCQPQEKT